MEGEIEYKDIPGYPGYRVGSDGSVWSCRTNAGRLGQKWRILKPKKNSWNQHYVALSVCGVVSRPRIAQVVLLSFVGPCPPGMEACHGNGNPGDNRLENLRWDTHKANMEDSIRHGTMVRGSKSPQTKLTENDVKTIISMNWNGWSGAKLSRLFGVGETTIYGILNRKSWRHVQATEETTCP
jgi:hypothetical protein